jgi:hypothetical protein
VPCEHFLKRAHLIAGEAGADCARAASASSASSPEAQPETGEASAAGSGSSSDEHKSITSDCESCEFCGEGLRLPLAPANASGGCTGAAGRTAATAGRARRNPTRSTSEVTAHARWSASAASPSFGVASSSTMVITSPTRRSARAAGLSERTAVILLSSPTSAPDFLAPFSQISADHAPLGPLIAPPDTQALLARQEDIVRQACVIWRRRNPKALDHVPEGFRRRTLLHLDSSNRRYSGC